MTDWKLYIARHGLKLEAEPASVRQDGSDFPQGSQGWRCRIFNAEGECILLDFFANPESMNLPLVLEALASDAATMINNRSFEDWCAELGFDAVDEGGESRRIFALAERQHKQLEALFGSSGVETFAFCNGEVEFEREDWEEFSDQAENEGWNIFELTADGSIIRLMASDDAGVFHDDLQAWSHVREKAADGNRLHIVALEYLRQFAPTHHAEVVSEPPSFAPGT